MTCERVVIMEHDGSLPNGILLGIRMEPTRPNARLRFLRVKVYRKPGRIILAMDGKSAPQAGGFTYSIGVSQWVGRLRLEFSAGYRAYCNMVMGDEL